MLAYFLLASGTTSSRCILNSNTFSEPSSPKTCSTTISTKGCKVPLSMKLQGLCWKTSSRIYKHCILSHKNQHIMGLGCNIPVCVLPSHGPYAYASQGQNLLLVYLSSERTQRDSSKSMHQYTNRRVSTAEPKQRRTVF